MKHDFRAELLAVKSNVLEAIYEELRNSDACVNLRETTLGKYRVTMHPLDYEHTSSFELFSLENGTLRCYDLFAEEECYFPLYEIDTPTLIDIYEQISNTED